MAIVFDATAVADASTLTLKAAFVAANLSAGGVSHMEVLNAGATVLYDFILSGSDPEFTSSAAVWSMDLTPAVTANAEAALTDEIPALWRLYRGDGTLAYTGTCTGSTVSTGDVGTVGSMSCTEQA